MLFLVHLDRVATAQDRYGPRFKLILDQLQKLKLNSWGYEGPFVNERCRAKLDELGRLK